MEPRALCTAGTKVHAIGIDCLSERRESRGQYVQRRGWPALIQNRRTARAPWCQWERILSIFRVLDMKSPGATAGTLRAAMEPLLARAWMSPSATNSIEKPSIWNYFRILPEDRVKKKRIKLDCLIVNCGKQVGGSLSATSSFLDHIKVICIYIVLWENAMTFIKYKNIVVDFTSRSVDLIW